MNSFMASELDRLARVAVGHGPGDPAVDVFLVFVGALDPQPDAATLKPAAQRIGKLRLAQALDRPGDPRLGACRLLAAASVALPGPAVAPPPASHDQQPVGVAPRERARPEAVGGGSRAGSSRFETLTVERPVETGRRLPELLETLQHAIRAGLSLFASR